MVESARYWIEKLNLVKHPEGGYYREVYRSEEFVHKKNLPDRYSSYRSFSTSIYFLLEKDDFSAFHRLKSDELWHFYEGSAIHLVIIFPGGEFREIVMGRDAKANEVFQAVIPKGCWFAAYGGGEGSFSLAGCTVAPGFDFEDLELGTREGLIKLFPQHAGIIKTFTR
jgi:predicted cupin superfamily sugar epimerase